MAFREPTKQDIDNTAPQIALDLRRALDNVRIFKQWLDTVSVAQLEAMGYSNAEATNLKSSYADLDHLVSVANGEGIQSGQSNFFTFPKRLWGFGLR